MKVDVVLLTKNSNTPIFKYVLRSLYENVYVNRLIVIDGGSTDGTIEVLRKYPRVEIHYDYGTRATAREKGIKLVDTEWFLFLDSDVILCKDWLKRAKRHIKDDVGAVQGIDIPILCPEVQDFYYAINRIRGMLKKKKYVSKRGFTGDVLIRTDLVKDIKIPSFLHVYEDYYIRKWIERKGYKWLIVEDPYCYHAMGDRLSRVYYDSYVGGYFGRAFGLYRTKSVVKAVITIFPIILFALCLRPNFRMAKLQILQRLYFLAGYMRNRSFRMRV